jgi:hypothetical protein
VPRINTGIRNPSIGHSELYGASQSRAARAAAKFMRGVKDLQYRFLNATNWKCKTAPPRDGLTPAEFREQDFLRKLSKGRMDPLDSMLGLVRLTDVQPNAFSDLAVTRHQAQRMLDNLDAHGEIYAMLHEGSEQKGPHQAFFQKLEQDYETLVTKLMMFAGSSKDEHQPVPVAGDSRLDTVKILAGFRSAVGDTRSSAKILAEQLVLAKDLRREFDGTREQKEFAAQLAEVKDTFKRYNEIRPKPLTKMMTSALRKVGVDAPDSIVQTNVKWLTKVPKHIQASLLPPLLEAMSDVIDGTGSAKHDLKRALDAVKRAAKHTQQHIIRLDNLALSIAMQELRTDTEFVQLAEKHLRSLTYEARMRYLTQADTKPTISVAPLLQRAVQNLANEAALDLINEYYLDYTKGEDLNAVCQKIRALDDDSLIVIAWFFDRNPWIPAYFYDLAANQPIAQPLSAIINEFGNTASKRLGYETPTEMLDSQYEDLKRFFRDFPIQNPWGDLYSFFVVPDETKPQDRGDE